MMEQNHLSFPDSTSKSCLSLYIASSKRSSSPSRRTRSTRKRTTVFCLSLLGCMTSFWVTLISQSTEMWKTSSGSRSIFVSGFSGLPWWRGRPISREGRGVDCSFLKADQRAILRRRNIQRFPHQHPYLLSWTRPELFHSTTRIQSSLSTVSSPTVLSRLDNATFHLREHCDLLFDLDLPEGRCVGLQLRDSKESRDGLAPTAIAENPQHWIHHVLHPEEVVYGISQPSENGRNSFLLGRLALREALKCEAGGIDPMTITSYCILKDEHGRPNVPRGFLGSISHKHNTAVALVAVDRQPTEEAPLLGIGVDVEEAFADKSRIARKVLTKNEIESLGKVEGVSRDEEVLLRFSIKESLYKAMHPLICQYVAFQEVEVHPHSDGSAAVLFQLKSGAHENFGIVDAHWKREGQYFLSSACVRLKERNDDEPCEL